MAAATVVDMAEVAGGNQAIIHFLGDGLKLRSFFFSNRESSAYLSISLMVGS